MPRNTAAGKAAIGPLNTSDGETITVLTPQEELMAAKGSFTNFFSPVRAHLCDAARWIKLRPNRWIVSATSKRLCRGVDSDLFGLAPIWSGRLAPLCIGCGSGDFAAGVAWI